MARHTIPVDRYLEAAQVFHWATKEHFILWFTGELARHRRTESLLHRLVQKDKLRCVKFGKRLVYTVPRRMKGKKPTLVKEKVVYEPGVSEEVVAGRNKIVHGLACTESLIRFWRSRMDGEIIAERYFYGCGAVPEWGIRYPNGKMLLFEFCTKHNFFFANMMSGKLSAYERNTEIIEEKFKAKALILFVVDIPRPKVERYAGSLERAAGSAAGAPPDIFFTDYETFLGVPLGQQLTASIYYWSLDGGVYPLSQNAGLEPD